MGKYGKNIAKYEVFEKIEKKKNGEWLYKWEL